MKKIGTTSAGTVIVEMSGEAFEALERLQTTASSAVSPREVKSLTRTELVAYVRERIAKLRPKRKERLASSIRAMFQFNGGVTEEQVEQTIAALQKEKFLTADAGGKITYQGV